MKSTAIKFGSLILASTIILYATQQVFKYTMQSCKIGTIGKINAVMDHSLDKEVTIWGASTALLNFNPQVLSDSLGYSTVNMGVDGTSIDQYGGLLQEYLSYTKNSKYIVIAIDIHGGITNRNSLYNLHNWIHHIDNDRIYTFLSDIDEPRVWKIRHIPFYALTQYDKHAFPFFRRSFLQKKTEYSITNNGYHPNGYGHINIDFEYDSAKKQSIAIGTRCLNKIRTLSLKARSLGITPIVAITPCYVKGFNQLVNAQEVILLLRELGGHGIRVLDYSQSEMSSSFMFFKDNTHLNENGAIELSRLLASDINRIEQEPKDL